MKKIIIILIGLSLIFSVNNLAYGEDGISGGEYVLMRVTEPIPGLECEKVDGTHQSGSALRTESGSFELPILYDCKVKKGPAQIIEMLGNILKYFTYIASLLGVLFIIYNGIMYSMSGIDDQMKSNAKTRIIFTLVGLAILFLSGPFLQLIAPWVYN